MIKCTECDGKGKTLSRTMLSGLNEFENELKTEKFDGFEVTRFKGYKVVEVTCDLCAGTGSLSDEKIDWIIQGQKLKEFRLYDKKMSLRDAAKFLKISPVELSNIERGVIQPRNVWKDNETV